MLVLGQLLGALHFALVKHVVCPEHGEITHVASGFTQWVSSSSDSSTGVFNTRPFDSTRTEIGDDHQHCLVQALRRDGATRTRVLAPVISRESPDCALWLASTPHKESALFRLAPKHSPPT